MHWDAADDDMWGGNEVPANVCRNSFVPKMMRAALLGLALVACSRTQQPQIEQPPIGECTAAEPSALLALSCVSGPYAGDAFEAELEWSVRLEGWGQTGPPVVGMSQDGVPTIAVTRSVDEPAGSFLYLLNGVDGSLRTLDVEPTVGELAVDNVVAGGPMRIWYTEEATAGTRRAKAVLETGEESVSSMRFRAIYGSSGGHSFATTPDGQSVVIGWSSEVDRTTGERIPMSLGPVGIGSHATYSLQVEWSTPVLFYGGAFKDYDIEHYWMIDGWDGSYTWALAAMTDKLHVFHSGYSQYGLISSDQTHAMLTTMPWEDRDVQQAIGTKLSCVGDLDGDGDDDVGLLQSTPAGLGGDVLALVDFDDGIQWSVQALGVTLCTTVDLDVDGQHEIVIAGWDGVHVLSGATGRTLLTFDGGNTPEAVVADIDLDGSAEIVVVSQDVSGFFVNAYGHPDNGWPTTSPVWHAHDFAGSNVNLDGTIPKHPDPVPGLTGAFRGHPSGWGPGADLYPAVEACATACGEGGEVRLSALVGNAGSYPLRAEAEVRLLAVRGGQEEVLETMHLHAIPAPGEAVDLPEWAVDYAALDGAELWLEVEAPGVRECSEQPNRVQVEWTCPE